jgi:hypothetical protein
MKRDKGQESEAGQSAPGIEGETQARLRKP